MSTPEPGELSPDQTRYWDGEPWQWQPLWLVPDQVRAVVGRLYGREVDEPRYLASGLLNQSWQVDDGDRKYVLRVSRKERSADQVAYEHLLTRALRPNVPVVVAPLPGKDGSTLQLHDEHALSLFPYVQGTLGAEVPGAERAHGMAVTLAAIHRATVALRLPQRPGWTAIDGPPRWIWPEVEPLLRRDLARASDSADALDALDVIATEVAYLDRWLDDLARASRPQPRAVVHGDLNPRNVLFENGTPTAVIDWDECRVDLLAWEVAQVAFHSTDGVFDYDLPDFWKTYLDAGGPLEPDDFALLGRFTRIGQLSELQYTVKNGRATPHAADQVREIANGLVWLREHDTA